jgi:hypothetical protein
MRVRIRAMCAAVLGKLVNAACTHVDDGRAVHTVLQVCRTCVCSTHWKAANEVGDCARTRGAAASAAAANATRSAPDIFNAGAKFTCAEKANRAVMSGEESGVVKRGRK